MRKLLFGYLAMTLVAHATDESWLPPEFALRNLAQHVFPAMSSVELPIVVPPFEEQVRVPVEGVSIDDAKHAIAISLDEKGAVQLDKGPAAIFEDGKPLNASVVRGDETWYGTDAGLYLRTKNQKAATRHADYGIDGPLATRITALAVDSKNTLWVGTPLGLGQCDAEGKWTNIAAHDGMPVVSVTALTVAPNDDLWIGTPEGATLYRPNADSRKWFYREGKRYLPNDNIRSIATAADGKTIYFLTDAGVGALQIKTTTLLEKAQTIEKLVNERHRREGLVAACVFDRKDPAVSKIYDNDNDGLWTAYHVAAMSLCFGATKDEAAKQSATESMHALYMLQNVSGIPGLVARSVLSIEEGQKRDKQWQPSPDGIHYWKSDTSSDEIDGHYLAFYTFFEHIAKNDPVERDVIVKQVRALTDHLVDHNYQLVDWTGKRTRWGFWDPKTINENPMEYGEVGLNSLQMLSFLKVAYYITGDKKYEEHFRKLAIDHHYLENVMLTKHSFPEENNHSDDQLGFVAWYPILQIERDPKARQALLRGVSRHYEVVRAEQPSFYTFVYATIDPGNADIPGAAENLRQIPTDRRIWAQKNSHRVDVEFNPHPNRFRKPVLTRALPADERVFEKWNGDPYTPDNGGDGAYEDDGVAFLLPYWMGRFHGFIVEQ